MDEQLQIDYLFEHFKTPKRSIKRSTQTGIDR